MAKQKAKNVNASADLQKIDFSKAKVVSAKILDKMVSITVRVAGRAYVCEDAVHRPQQIFERVMGDLSAITDRVLKSSNSEDYTKPYAFSIGYDQDDKIQYVQISGKLFLAGTQHKTSIALPFPKLYPAGEGTLSVDPEEMSLVQDAQKQALRFVCGHYSNPDLFAEDKKEEEEPAAV